MATWQNISNGAVAVGGIPASSTVTALRDNPIAIAEGAKNAPINRAAWHYYNSETVGDGTTGLIYNSTVNGTVTEVLTPDFEDGYEYRLVISSLTHNSGSDRSLILYTKQDGESTYNNVVWQTTAETSIYSVTADSVLTMTRHDSFRRVVQAPVVRRLSFLGSTVNYETVYGTLRDGVLGARIKFSGGSINGGSIRLLRRLDYSWLTQV